MSSVWEFNRDVFETNFRVVERDIITYICDILQRNFLEHNKWIHNNIKGVLNCIWNLFLDFCSCFYHKSLLARECWLKWQLNYQIKCITVFNIILCLALAKFVLHLKKFQFIFEVFKELWITLFFTKWRKVSSSLNLTIMER